MRGNSNPSDNQLFETFLRTDKFEIGWYDTERTTILCRYWQPLNWDDIHNAVGAKVAHSSRLSAPIYTILLPDNTPIALPTENTISNIATLFNMKQANDALGVIVKPSRMAKSFVDIVLTAYQFTRLESILRYADTLEDALHIVAEAKRHSMGNV